jgi:putative NADPH-quinone reductase
MTKTLLLFFHPAPEKSRHNKALLAELVNAKPANVTVRNLNELYGANGEFNIAEEQAVWEAHDRIVLHFPLNWYNVPHRLKKYIDELFVMGWFYGDKYKLEGKTLTYATSGYGTAEWYAAGGYNGFSVDELLRNLQVLATFGKMKYTSGLSLLGCWNGAGISEEKLASVAKDYVKFVAGTN